MQRTYAIFHLYSHTEECRFVANGTSKLRRGSIISGATFDERKHRVWHRCAYKCSFSVRQYLHLQTRSGMEDNMYEHVRQQKLISI